MMKFFRKYNKQLLAVFMALLMIVFIGGSALQTLLEPDINHVVATSKYGNVMFKDQENARATTGLLEATGIPWQYPAGARRPIEIVDWMLLQREAAAMGATIQPIAARSTAVSGQLDDRIDRAARARRIRPDAIYNALAQLMTIEQAASGAIGVNTPSDAELSIAARNALETVEMDAVVLPGRAFVDSSQTFSKEEMQAQLQKYKDRERGQGLNFGYYQGTSVKAQYIQINRDALANALVIGDLEKKARQHYDQKRDKDPIYRRGADEPLPPDPFRDGQLVGPALAPPPYKEWESAKEKAIETVKKEQANELANRIANWLLQYSNEAWADADREKTGYKKPPGEVAQLDHYNRLIERLPPNLNFAGTLNIGSTILFTEKEADAIPPLSKAMFRPESGAPRSFRNLAFRSQPAVPEIPSGEGVNQNEYIATWQSSQYPLADAGTGDVFIFRLVDSKPPHAPESVDEVHDQIVEDLRLIKAMERARSHAEGLEASVQAGSALKEAFDEDLELADLRAKNLELGFFEPAPFTRVPKGQAARGRMPMGMFVPNGVGMLTNDVIDGIFAMKNDETKLKQFEVSDRAAVVVVHWHALHPAPEDEFNQMKKTLVTEISRERRTMAMGDWMDPEKIRARSQFALATR